MGIKAVVWDLDGTLIHFKIDYILCRKEAIKILRENGVPKHLLSVKEGILENVTNAREHFVKMGKDKNSVEDILNNVNQAVIRVEQEAAINATAFKGIKEVLEYIKELKIKQAVYTLNTRNNARISLEKAELSNFFNIIMGRDNVINSKPHPDHLLKICDELKVNASDIIVIGDTWRDIKGALNVGARSIAIETKISKVSSSPNIRDFFKATRIIKPEEISSKLLEIIKEFF